VLDIDFPNSLTDSYYIHKVSLKDGTTYSRTAHFVNGAFLEFTTDWIKETVDADYITEEINKLLPLIYAGL